MSVFESVLLGLVQGVTEFLPVSSSGHLAVLEYLWKLPVESRLPLTTMLHGATVLVTFVFFFPQIVRIVTGLWASDSSRRKASWTMVFFIVIATIPAVLVAVLLRHAVEESFANPMHVGLMFLVTGLVLFGTRYTQPKGRGGWFRALLVGVAQAIAALFRGISRSGATISTGLYLGMEREQAFNFSFLLSIPAITGEFLLDVRKVDTTLLKPATVAVGMVVAFVTGLAALYALRRMVVSRKLYLFAFYCWAAGLAVILFVR